jgi:hypothetical protein
MMIAPDLTYRQAQLHQRDRQHEASQSRRSAQLHRPPPAPRRQHVALSEVLRFRWLSGWRLMVVRATS